MPFILDEFKYYAETPFDTTDKDFPQCDIDRPPKAPIDGRMLIMNHFLDIELFPGILIPDVGSADQTNSVSSILAQSDLCYGNFKRMPNVVLVSPLSFLVFGPVSLAPPYTSVGVPVANQAWRHVGRFRKHRRRNEGSRCAEQFLSSLGILLEYHTFTVP